MTPSNISFANLDTYAAQGFNTINVVPGGDNQTLSYPTADLTEYWNHMDEINFFNIYDMRANYQNTSLVKELVEQWMNRTTLLMWYTAGVIR